MRKPAFRFLLFILFIALSPLHLKAQTLGTSDLGNGSSVATSYDLSELLTPEAVRDMVSRMPDDQVRGLLLERLDAVAEAQAENLAAPVSTFDRIKALGSGLLQQWSAAFRNLPNVVSQQAAVLSTFGEEYSNSGLLTLFGLIAVTLAVGYAFERLAGFVIQRWRPAAQITDQSELREAVSFLFRRFIRELLGLIVFYTAISFVGRRLLDTEQLVFAVPFVFYLIWLPRLAAAISRFILAPKQPKVRLVSVDTNGATNLYRNFIGLAFLVGLQLFIAVFDAQNGLETGALILFWLNIAIHAYIAYIAWSARDSLIDIMRGSDLEQSDFDQKIARSYPYYTIAVSTLAWFAVELMVVVRDPETLALLKQGAHYTTMIWLLAAPALDTVIRGLVRHRQPPMIGHGPMAEAAHCKTKRSYIRIGRVLVGVVIAMMIAQAWNISLRELASSELGVGFGDSLIAFAMTVGVGFVIYELYSVWINRRLAREEMLTPQVEEAGGDGGGAGKSRLATVLPLLLIMGQSAIAVIFGLLAVGTLGIDIAPLLAGAGILGLAIGFGAQKLVTDIVSGIFFLIDDAFRMGEYIDVGGTMGTVEKIAIRSMQLRHHRGNVHTIPYGSIDKVTNFSRDWVIMKLMFTVPFDTDPNKVKKIFKKIGAEMMEDPLFKDDFLEAFKSQGVFQFDDVGIVMRGKFMAKPGTQFTIRKEIYNRVRNEFKEAGIEFARREVRVAIPGMQDHDDLNVEQAAAVAAAAGSAVQAQIEQEAAAKSKK